MLKTPEQLYVEKRIASQPLVDANLEAIASTLDAHFHLGQQVYTVKTVGEVTLLVIEMVKEQAQKYGWTVTYEMTQRDDHARWEVRAIKQQERVG